MRTTLNIPDDLMRAVKIMAAEQNRTLQDVIAELLRKGLGRVTTSNASEKVSLPLVVCAHANDTVTPEFTAALLLDEETDDSLRH